MTTSVFGPIAVSRHGRSVVFKAASRLYGIKTPRDVGRLGVRRANPFVLPLLLPVEWANEVAHNFSPIRASATPDFGKCERRMERL